MRSGRSDKAVKRSRGGRNLALLGVLSVVIAFATTGVSLAIYHNSGDIYIDRSRPGFLPDEAEIETEGDRVEEGYDFGKNGALTVKGLQEYLDKLTIEIQAIDAYEKPFSEDILSDEHLGITVEEPTE